MTHAAAKALYLAVAEGRRDVGSEVMALVQAVEGLDLVRALRAVLDAPAELRVRRALELAAVVLDSSAAGGEAKASEPGA